jgi:hypothetical protein
MTAQPEKAAMAKWLFDLGSWLRLIFGVDNLEFLRCFGKRFTIDNPA